VDADLLINQREDVVEIEWLLQPYAIEFLHSFSITIEKRAIRRADNHRDLVHRRISADSFQDFNPHRFVSHNDVQNHQIWRGGLDNVQCVFTLLADNDLAITLRFEHLFHHLEVIRIIVDNCNDWAVQVWSPSVGIDVVIQERASTCCNSTERQVVDIGGITITSRG
jgi:hypothetical protein